LLTKAEENVSICLSLIQRLFNFCWTFVRIQIKVHKKHDEYATINDMKCAKRFRIRTTIAKNACRWVKNKQHELSQLDLSDVAFPGQVLLDRRSQSGQTV